MAGKTSKMILLGIKGFVVSIDRGTGAEFWRTKLKGGDFVNVVVDEDSIYAGTQGEVFCLDPATGSIRWHNPLKGLGWGLVSISTEGGSFAARSALLAEKRRREETAAKSAGAASY